MTIPKVIHYCWFGGMPLPKIAQKCISSWKKYCPDYEIVQHNEKNYDVNSLLYCKQAYEAGKLAFVSDVARLDIIYNEGGIYLDVDVELLAPLDEYLIEEGFMGFEGEKWINTGLGFAARQYSPIVKAMLNDYRNKSFLLEDGSYDLTTCPITNTNSLLLLGLKNNGEYQDLDGFRFYPREYFSPKDFLSGKLMYLTNNTVSIHHYNGSWQTKKAIVKIKFYRIFGYRVGSRIYKVYLKLFNQEKKNE